MKIHINTYIFNNTQLFLMYSSLSLSLSLSRTHKTYRHKYKNPFSIYVCLPEKVSIIDSIHTHSSQTFLFLEFPSPSPFFFPAPFLPSSPPPSSFPSQGKCIGLSRLIGVDCQDFDPAGV